MVQRLLYKLLLKGTLSHAEMCVRLCTHFYFCLLASSLIAPSCYFSSSHLDTHSLSFGLPRCAMVQVYVFAGAHHYSNENDHCSSVFIHIQLRAPATICVHVFVVRLLFYLFFFVGCGAMLSAYAVSMHTWRLRGTKTCVLPIRQFVSY